MQKGCSFDSDCANSGLGDTWECHFINTVGFCVEPCTSDAQCVNDLMYGETATCSGTTNTPNMNYCVEAPA